MVTKSSPGGSNFPYYYKGGEIHCFKYGSFSSDEAGLLAVMQAEETFLLAQPGQYAVWVDFYETHLNGSLLLQFAESMQRMRPKIVKLAIVGCSFFNQQRLSYLKKTKRLELPSFKYFSDPEDAKTWLVTEFL